MKEYFLSCGLTNIIYITILTLLLMLMIIRMAYPFYHRQNKAKEDVLKSLEFAKSIGLFALMTGILFHLIGFYQAFNILEKVGNISPGVLFGGLKVSMVTTIYGLIIYLLAQGLWFALSRILVKNA